MADVSKLKRKTLGTPPPMEEASSNLNAPETVSAAHLLGATSGQISRMDGRSARRTNRTLQFATRVKPEWDAELRELARRDGLLLVEVLERALELYKNIK
ncbi:hypothetical protein [Candidatus Igneacidithiobacillus taiwanensis]|uniref:hypothetical protein n=1 Tax=Candidatus Igneacidithiobacillus taiwanensis TaxID=1945924 RepID=UPI00289A4D4E|nr:hypothetical protein [Candidatus Igneacidithiobacillus taiwanensis]